MKGLQRACVAACLLLAGCVTVPDRKAVAIGELSTTAEAAAIAALQAREQRLRALPMLAFSGRVALSNGRSGGSGRIEWQQSGDRYEVTLSAPVSRQSWRLSGDAESARIEQDGWTVDYLGWREEHPGDSGTDGGRPPLLLPDRINAARGDARVRLAVDAWSWAPEAP
jgi:outer membrane biogenesis lipoprotein LolB